MRQEYLFRAMQPISQGMETKSNIIIIQTKKIVQLNGLYEQAPVVTANAMCNRLIRTPGAQRMVDICGIKELKEEGLQWLFNGGNLLSGGASIKIDDQQATRRLIPLFSLIGGGYVNSLIKGKLQISNNKLLCKESLHTIPKESIPKDVTYLSGFEYIQLETYVNTDPSRDIKLSTLLCEDIRQQTKEERGKSTIMPWERTSVAEGSLWYWTISSAYPLSKLEIGALNCSLKNWDGYVGGRVNRGYGLLKNLNPFSIDHIKEYEQHLRDHAQEIRDFVHSEMMEKKKKDKAK